MLKRVNFNLGTDTLYLLGDYVDWGEESIELILQLMEMTAEHEDNIICLMGNHDKMMLDVVSNVSDTEDISKITSYRVRDQLRLWFHNGGEETYISYRKQSESVRTEIKKWLTQLRYFITDVRVGTEQYYLCHSRPMIKGMGLNDVIWDRIKPDNLEKQFTQRFPNTTLISGHTITKHYNSYDSLWRYKIFKPHGIPYINIDCGAKVMLQNTQGGLGCIRLEDRREYYVYGDDIT